MPELKTLVQENAKERQRLKALTESLKDADFNRILPNGWTLTSTLVHLAFWDLRQLSMLNRWLEEKVEPGSLDAEAINGPLNVIATGVTGPAAVKLAVEAAETVDHQVEKLTPAQAEELLKKGLERNLHRAIHRKNHLDKMEKALGR